MKDQNQNTSSAGSNPFSNIKVMEDGKLITLGSTPNLKTPSGSDSKAKYADIKDNIETWIEDAIDQRKKYK